jgi:hypothetical protein
VGGLVPLTRIVQVPRRLQRQVVLTVAYSQYKQQCIPTIYLPCAALRTRLTTLQACKRLLQNLQTISSFHRNSPSPPTFPFRLDQHSHYPAISSCRKACTEPRPLIGQGSGLATLLFAALTGNGVSVFQLAFLFPGRSAPETSHTNWKYTLTNQT